MIVTSRGERRTEKKLVTLVDLFPNLRIVYLLVTSSL